MSWSKPKVQRAITRRQFPSPFLSASPGRLRPLWHSSKSSPTVHTRNASTSEGPVPRCSSPQIRRSQLSCLTTVHSGVQAQIKRWLARKHFYFHVEGRFPGISPSCFASVATITVHIIADFPPGWVQDILITCLTFIFHFELALLLSHKKKMFRNFEYEWWRMLQRHAVWILHAYQLSGLVSTYIGTLLTIPLLVFSIRFVVITFRWHCKVFRSLASNIITINQKDIFFS